ncbi:hypothetical protein HZA87_05170 [Candidatus Uhrbacteria bacterium]|nr:hypothetical protein [Candidatus Uhrbacteria bacterium]
MRPLIFLALVGCATIHKPVGEEAPVITYWGTARGAATIADAERSYDLAQSAMDKGVPTSLLKSDDTVMFSAGNGYGYGVYQGPGGYAPPDIVSTPGGWYAPSGLKGSLPTLGTMVVVSTSESPASVPTDTSGGIVPCPKYIRRTVAEQAACAERDAKHAYALLQEMKKK